MPDTVPQVSDRTLSLTHRLGAYVAGTRHEAIPPNVVKAAKTLLVDTLAVAWAGSDAPGCREAHALMAEEGGRPDATAWVFGGRLPVISAAFLNGMTASALDYDSIQHDVSMHVDIAVLPAALAVAERQHASGRDFLTAIILGSEICCRMAAAAAHPPRGFHNTGAMGGLGAAAAAARLLGLDASRTGHALGLAFVQASGTQQANIEPSLSKRLLSAFAARSGVTAALLAQRGITAPAQALEGKFGFYALYQDGDAEQLMDGLGTRFGVHRQIKRFPSCGANHTTIQGMLDLVREHDLKPDDVEAVELTVPPYIERLVGHPYDPGKDPQVAAQFNIRYSVACALVRRRLGLAEIQPDAARDPEINRHVHKVSIQVDPQHKGTRAPVTIRMRTRNRGELTRTVTHVPGDPRGQHSDAGVREKFDECFRLGVRPLNEASIASLIHRADDLEKLDDMARFFE